jgi:hypothetical protein
MSRHISFDDTKKTFFRLTDILDVGVTNYQTLRHHLTELRAAAMRLSNLAEQECNGVIGPDGHAKWDEQDQAKNEKARQKAEDRALRAVEFLVDAETFKRLEIEFQPDPRGPSVIIHVKDQHQRAACFW